MQTFLTFIHYKNKKLSIVEFSSEIHILDDANITIIFNGKLLNKEILAKELALKKDESSIVETISKAYEKWNILFLEKLEGSFSLLIYDKHTHKLHITKDKIAAYPLYFTQTKESIIVGTHLRKFNKVNKFKLIINPSALANYLQFGFVLQPASIFKNCYKVQAGEYITFDLDTKKHTKNSYWKLESCYEEHKTKENEVAILKTADHLLQESIEQSSKNSNYGLSLSGGYDSSTLTAIAQAQSEKKVNTFSIGFHENKINEAPYAKAIASHLGTNHHEHYFTAKDALRLIPKMCKTYDEPFADHAASPTMLTAELLKANNIDNLLAGDGGDEVFATAEDVHLFERLQNTPKLFKNLIRLPLSYLPSSKIYKLQQILLANSIPQMIQARNTLFLEQELKGHIKGYMEPIQTSFDEISFRGSAQAVDEIIGTYFKTTMADGELVKSYASMNTMNINLSIPFLHSTLVNYMATVPSSIKIKNGTKKYLLKEIAHKYIPQKLIDRPKSGFDIPFASWMRNELKDILYFQINKERLDKDNIFYTSSIINIRNQFYAGNDSYKYKLWRIFIFQLWYENFAGTLKK